MKTYRLALSLFACTVSAQNGFEPKSFLDLTEVNEADDNLLDLTSEYNDLSHQGYHHHNPYAEYASHHPTQPELDHDFDHHHDTHPYPYHEHSVLPAFDYGKQHDNSYDEFARAAEKRTGGPITTHFPHHRREHHWE